MLNAPSLTLKQAKPVVLQCIKQKMSCLLHGPVGVGKSSMVFDIAESLGYDFLDLRIAQFPYEDLAGLPVPEKKLIKVRTKEGKIKEKVKFTTFRSLPDYLPTDKNSKGILFLDEINQANPAVLHAIFELILDRSLSACNYSLPKGWAIIAACNEVEDNPEVTEFSRPLNNRFLHLNIIHSQEDWVDYAKKIKLNKKVIEFAKTCPNIFSVEDKSQVCFCTPRTLEQVSLFEDRFDSEKLNFSTLQQIVGGLLGLSTSVAYFKSTAMLRFDNNISLKDILLGKKALPKKFIDTHGESLIAEALTENMLSFSDEDWCKSVDEYNRIIKNLGMTSEYVFAAYSEFYPDSQNPLLDFKNDCEESYNKLKVLYPEL